MFSEHPPWRLPPQIPRSSRQTPTLYFRVKVVHNGEGGGRGLYPKLDGPFVLTKLLHGHSRYMILSTQIVGKSGTSGTCH